MIKIGILTYLREYNPGQYFQALGTYRALCEVFPKARVEFIDVARYPHRLVRKRDFLPLGKPSRYYRRVYGYVKAWSALPFSGPRLVTQHNELAWRFIDSLEYDLIVVGSDVVLLSGGAFKGAEDAAPFYWLSPKIRAHKILLAASADVTQFDSLSNRQRIEMSASAQAFDLCFVRDHLTHQLVRDLGRGSKHLEMVPDPTFHLQFPKNELRATGQELYNRRLGRNKGLVVGVNLGEKREHWKDKIVHRMVSEGIRVVALRPYPGTEFIGCLAPWEWVAVMTNFDVVLTYSFHETIFCFKQGVPVVSICGSPHLVHERTGKGKLHSLHNVMGTYETGFVNPFGEQPLDTASIIRILRARAAASDAARIKDKTEVLGNDYLRAVSSLKDIGDGSLGGSTRRGLAFLSDLRKPSNGQ